MSSTPPAGADFRSPFPDVRKGIEGVGFRFELPKSLLPSPGGDERVRVFAFELTTQCFFSKEF